jgi:hypothetical protein
MVFVAALIAAPLLIQLWSGAALDPFPARSSGQHAAISSLGSQPPGLDGVRPRNG